MNFENQNQNRQKKVISIIKKSMISNIIFHHIRMLTKLCVINLKQNKNAIDNNQLGNENI